MTEVPSGPDVGFRLATKGVTVKSTPLLGRPPTVTTTLPEVAPEGTGTVMLEALQLEGVARVPLKATVLVPCVAPKFEPEMMTDVPTGPEVGLKAEIFGAEPEPPTAARKATICMIHV